VPAVQPLAVMPLAIIKSFICCTERTQKVELAANENASLAGKRVRV